LATGAFCLAITSPGGLRARLQGLRARQGALRSELLSPCASLRALCARLPGFACSALGLVVGRGKLARRASNSRGAAAFAGLEAGQERRWAPASAATTSGDRAVVGRARGAHPGWRPGIV